MSGKFGDWAAVERMLSQAGNKLKSECEKTTGNLGPAFVALVVAHFTSQDLGWQPLSEKYARRKSGAASTQIRKLSKRTILKRMGKLGIAANENASKASLVGALSAGGNQILIATASLVGNINFQQLSAFSGYVGVLRREPKKGYDLAWIHEFGSRDGRIPARPFMRPSLKEFEPTVKAEYQAAVDRAFK